jgi:hypothetical protein
MDIIPFEDGVSPARVRKIRLAMDWLESAMEGQPQPAALMEQQAIAAGHAHTTIAEARKRLHVQSVRRGPSWWWMPSTRRQRKKQAVNV